MVVTGPDTAELMSLIEAENVERVIWRDEYVLDRAAMRCYLSAADVYAFTSRHEGFPVAPLEAMACGLPVVAMDCAGLRDILSDASDGGIITPLEDPRGLAESLARLLDDEVLRRKTGRDARRRVVESFGLDTVGDRLKKFLSASREIGTNDRMSAAIDWDRA
jgi:glycosyltransferase involved in cell wall biosynthesis